MTARRSLFVALDGDGTGTSPQDARLSLAGLLPVVGVLNGLGVTGSTSGSNMKYNVGAGVAICARGTVASDGVYPVPNDGTYLADSGAPAPASGTRWDLIWIQARNTQDGFGDPSSVPLIGVTVGVAAASPTKPYAAGSGVGGTSLPPGALVLAESLVGTGIANAGSATVTRVVKPVGMRGGILQTSGSSFYPTAPTVGQYIDDASLGLLRWDGTKWAPSLGARMQYKQTTAQTLTATRTKLTGMSSEFNTLGWTFASNAWTVPAGGAGQHEISGQVSIDATGSGLAIGAIFKNGVALFETHAQVASAAGFVTAVIPLREITVADGDVFDLRGYNSPSGDTQLGEYASFLRVKRVG